MVKRKKSVNLGSKNFFALVVLSVSALGIMFMTYASQQKTNTKSDAMSTNAMLNQVNDLAKDKEASWKYKGSTSGKKDVTYSLDLQNKGNFGTRYLVWVVVYTDDNQKTNGWVYKFQNRDNSENVPLRKTVEAKDSSGTKITVSRENAKVPKGKSTYKVKVLAAPCKNNDCRNINDTDFPYNLATYTTNYYVDN